MRSLNQCQCVLISSTYQINSKFILCVVDESIEVFGGVADFVAVVEEEGKLIAGSVVVVAEVAEGCEHEAPVTVVGFIEAFCLKLLNEHEKLEIEIL